MTQDILSAGIRAIYRGTLIPEFSKVTNLADSQKFFAEALDLAREFIISDSKSYPELEINFKLFLDHELEINLSAMLRELPENSFTYQYLALTSDFRKIQNLYTRSFGSDLKKVQADLGGLEKTLILKDIYHAAFEHESADLARYKNIFEYLSHIDHIFFEILIKIGSGSSPFIKNFIAHKIDTYNLTAYFRLKNLGRAEEFIRQFLISYSDSIPVTEINMEFINKTLAPFASGVNIFNTSLVEVGCQTRELKYLKQSIFEGVDEPAILFYLETLKIFFYNLKVLTLSREMNTGKNEVLPRLINYSVID